MKTISFLPYQLHFGVDKALPEKIGEFTLIQSPVDFMHATDRGGKRFLVTSDVKTWAFYQEGKLFDGKECIRTDLKPILIPKTP